MGEGEIVGLMCFGGSLDLLSCSSVNEFVADEQIQVHPLLLEPGPQIVGLEVFGNSVEIDSVAAKSAFLDVNQVRGHWLDQRSILSSWRTRNQNEDFLQVSLGYQLGSLSASPLLFDALPAGVGFAEFGGAKYFPSSARISLTEDLLDSLATEDFDPICTEDEMDEIALG